MTDKEELRVVKVHCLDADLDNADWIKQSWPFEETDVESLRKRLESDGMSVETFKQLPIYKRNLSRHPWLEDL